MQRILLVCTLLALPWLVGSKCAFFFSSGGGSDNDRKDREDDKDAVVVVSGNFDEPVIAGLDFTSGSITGVTGDNGEYQYEEGRPVQFSVGDIKLGEAVTGKPVITIADLTTESEQSEISVTNMARLLQSLDSDRSDELLTIPAPVRAAAVRSNSSVSAAIELLDFSDEQRFVNAASQLVATLTDDYPFTATLVDADSVLVRRIKKSN